MAHFLEEQVLCALRFLGSLQRAMQTFADHDEQDAHKNKAPQCAKMDVSILVPIKRSRREHRAQREGEKSGAAIEENGGSEYRRDEQNDAVRPAPSLQGEAQGEGKRNHSSAPPIAHKQG